MRLVLLFLISCALYAQTNLSQFGKIYRLTQSYCGQVNWQRCQGLKSCEEPGELEEYSEFCQLWKAESEKTLVLCYNAYSAEADRECLLTFNKEQELESFSQTCFDEFLGS